MTTRSLDFRRGGNATWLLAAVLGVGSLAGCAHPPRSGGSSFEVLGAPPPATGAAVEESRERIEFIPGYPRRELAKPVYPGAALAAGAGEHVVYVEVTVDETGRVADVQPSWRRIGSHGRWEGEFLQAVKAAVDTWMLTPAHQVYYARVAGAEERYLRTEAVPVTFEVRFAFEATGAVR